MFLFIQGVAGVLSFHRVQEIRGLRRSHPARAGGGGFAFGGGRGLGLPPVVSAGRLGRLRCRGGLAFVLPVVAGRGAGRRVSRRRAGGGLSFLGSGLPVSLVLLVLLILLVLVLLLLILGRGGRARLWLWLWSWTWTRAGTWRGCRRRGGRGRRRRLQKFLQLLLRQFPVVYRVGVLRVGLDRFPIMLDRVLQVGDPPVLWPLLGRGPLVKGVAEAVFRLFAQAGFARRGRLAERGDGVLVIAKLVGGGALVELEFLGVGMLLPLPLKILQRALEILLLVKVDAGVRRMRGARQEKDAGGGGEQGVFAPLPPFADEQRAAQEEKARRERPLVTLLRAAGELRVPVLFFQNAEPFVDDPLHVGGAVLQMGVGTARYPRDFPQTSLVQPRADDLPVFIPHEVRAPVLRRRGDDGARRRADADGEDAELARGLSRGVEDAAVQFLAVGEEDEAIALAFALAERLRRELDGLGDVRPSQRDGVHVQLVYGIENSSVVDGERRFEERAAREGDKPGAVAGQEPDKVFGGELGAHQPARLDVAGQHAFGSVDGDEDVPPARRDFFKSEPEPGTRERGDDECETGKEAGEPREPARAADAARQTRREAQGDHLLKQGRRTPFIPRVERAEERQDRRGPKPFRSAERHHGSFLHTVWDSAICKTSTPNPAPRNHGKSSVYSWNCVTSTFDFSSRSICRKTFRNVSLSAARK